MAVAAPAMERIVLPLTIIILTVLFSIQSKGTTTIGKLFGPVMMIWFLVLGIVGIINITQNPAILQAISPIYVLNFLSSMPIKELLIVLGFVVLVVTGVRHVC
jgi:KUP system potassium uptake protein